ncbi:hypothetical protein FG386_000069 [Cryptosporidium ryanae]|uniref:uncharacterized protein n=1 Tax=Cryptosporidium ryanae TaxID=515981 RepID=UPI00351A6F66|nr:hypothetical protein FG386_000069 [Cryptosporidium ryanae]
MSELDEIEHIHRWTLRNEDKSVCFVIYSLFQGLLCVANMIFGNYILILHYKEVSQDKNLLVILLITLFGELLIHIVSILLILLVRVLCGIRSLAYFVSIAGLLNIIFQSCFYYICFGISLMTIGSWYFSLTRNNNDFISHFIINYDKNSLFVNQVIMYFIIEAFISLNEIFYSIPIVFSAMGYGLSREISKIKGKPIVEFHKLDKPITFTRLQNYEDALNNIRNNSQVKPEHCYIEL